MVIKKHLKFVLLIMVLGSSSCKKYGHQYPEDPGRTEKTSIERLTNKWWKLKQTIVNGKEYTDTVENAIGQLQLYLGTSKDRDYYLGSYVTLQKPNGVTIVWGNNEEFESFGGLEHHTSNTIFTYAPFHFPLGSSNRGIHKILKLTESEFKLTSYHPNEDTIVTNIFGL